LVIPAIYLKLKAHDLLRFIPEEVVQAFTEIYELNLERNQQILKQIDDITAVLNKENIQPVFLKGTANLLDGLYSDVGERMIGDIDFLVQEVDFLKSAQILEGAGYSNQDLNDGTNLIVDHHHYPGLSKDGEPACVEIHSIPVVKKYSRLFTSELVFSQRTTIAGKENAYVPSDAHKAIHSFIHSQLSNRGHRDWVLSFRDLYDTYLISKRVKLYEVLNSVEEKFKAQVFYALFTRTFKLETQFPISNHAKVNSYIKRFDWWENHPALYSLYFRCIEVYQLIFIAYWGKIINALYSKPHRKYIWVRISNPKWYKAHFLLIKKKFGN